jgi:SAM-dependent methyltransferase
MTNNSNKEVAAAPGTHEEVIRLLLTYQPKLKGLEILDLPCGQGSFTRRLLGLSASVVASDLVLHQRFLTESNVFHPANANGPLPFQDHCFDVAISIEGIEHFENPSFFLRELYRILRPRGLAIVSTPNVNSLWSRWELFRRGYHSHFQPTSASKKMSGHQLPIDATFFRGASESAGFQLIEVSVSDSNRKSNCWEWVRPRLMKRLPEWIRNSPLAYGEVSIYVLQKI